MEEFEKLFTEINNLKEKHKEDDLFNGFVSFGIGANETKHSRFIGMLLNPKGSHKQKDKFLRLFLKQLEITDFAFENINIECEKQAKRRRIDIAIWNKTHFIVIENKFWARDQNNQLRDYYNFALNCSKNIEENVLILYLTPYGSKPSMNSYSIGELADSLNPLQNDKVICISYQKHILNWLEVCIDSLNSSDNIRLKTSLEMYVELIRNIINRDKYMIEIMNNLKSNSQNMELAIDIVKSFQGVNFLDDEYFGQSIVDQIIKLANNYGCEVNDEADGVWVCGKSWYIIELNKNNNIVGTICFDSGQIYAEKNMNKRECFNIFSCNDINNTTLRSLLIKNKDGGVKAWMDETAKYFEIYDI